MKRPWLILAIGGILLLIGGIWWFGGDKPAELPDEALPEEPVTLYFYNMDTAQLSIHKRTVAEASSPSERVQQIITELKTAPDTDTIRALLPENLELRSVFFENQTVFLDFNGELIGAAEGSSGEMLLLYSMVNSVLANLSDDYKLVHFLVQGEMRKTIGPYGEESGHIAIQYPLGPRWDLADSF